MRTLLFILLSLSSFAQTKDWVELQGKIDSAIKYKTVLVDIGYRSYVIDRPLIAAQWDSIKKDYTPFTIHIIGHSTMWDVGGISQITALHKDGPALAIHRGKGCVIRGINFQGAYRVQMSDSDFFKSEFKDYGDKTCRDAQYSPYAAIVIDPFRSNLPPDGGYPTLTSYYRGLGGNGGSTGFQIDNCTFNNFTIGMIFSPNGQTANCDLMKVEDIRIYNTKAGIVGCQAQEKSIKLNNINCWGRTHTLFVWGPYGNGTPGMYTINGVQIAGGVVRLVNRISGGYFPLQINDVFTEQLGSIGQWHSLVGDRLSNSSIGFVPPEIAGFPNGGHIYGQQAGKGMTIENCNLRYYGKQWMPLLLNGTYTLNNCFFDTPPMTGYKGLDDTKMVKIGSTEFGHPVYPDGTIVALCHYGSWIWQGQGMFKDGKIIYSNLPVKNYGVMIYKKL